MSSCRSCQAPIMWATTERGKSIPLDLEPYRGDSPAGLFVLRGRTAIAVTPEAFPDEPVYRSHFSTCPHAAEHRR
jgi:hypothetical protein